MKMTQKVAMLFAAGMLIPGTATTSPFSTAVGTGATKAYQWSKTGAMYAFDKIPANVKSHFQQDLATSTTLPDLGFGAGTATTNKTLLATAVASAALSTYFISEKNSKAEVATSALFSALGTSFALKQLAETDAGANEQITALLAYVAGQRGNDVMRFIANAFYNENPVKAVKDVFFKRRTTKENLDFLVTLLAAPAVAYRNAIAAQLSTIAPAPAE